MHRAVDDCESRQEIEALQRYLDDLARDTDEDLIGRYELQRPPVPPGLYWRLRWLAGWTLRWLESTGIWRPAPWPVSLRQGRAKPRAKPLLIWAVGTDRDKLRKACDGFSRLRDSLPGFAPVLVTDVADFAFFSRLGWLVEYVPRMVGEGEAYDERKMRFLARLYRGAPALPVSVCLETASRANDIRRWIARGAIRESGSS
jgi:hypothetical protein